MRALMCNAILHHHFNTTATTAQKSPSRLHRLGLAPARFYSPAPQGRDAPAGCPGTVPTGTVPGQPASKTHKSPEHTQNSLFM